jgi:hypothetical protein
VLGLMHLRFAVDYNIAHGINFTSYANPI